MNTRTTFYITFISFLLILFSSFTFGQTPGGTNKTRTQQVEDSEASIRQVTDESGRAFKEALLALKDNDRLLSRVKFDESLEVFLMSTLNVQRNQTLSRCYNQLIETIYHIEFRSDQAPNIRSLSSVCNWNIKNDLADEIAQLAVHAPDKTKVASNDTLVKSADEKPDINGFDEQRFVFSPLEKLQLTVEEENIERNSNFAVANTSRGETWDSLANKLGYSAEELRALNGNTAVPGRKIFIPQRGIGVANTGYSRPTSQPTTAPVSNIKIVKAKAGETVAQLAKRVGADPVEVAKFNGLWTISKSHGGREIKIPLKQSESEDSFSTEYSKPNTIYNEKSIGEKPVQYKNGKVPIVVKYIDDNFHDPYSVKYLKWSNVEKKVHRGKYYWFVSLKLRAKNAFNAYRLTVINFYIQNNEIIFVEDLN